MNVVHNIHRKNYVMANEELQSILENILRIKMLDMKKTIAANLGEQIISEGIFGKKRRRRSKSIGFLGKLILQHMKNREIKHRIKEVKARKDLKTTPAKAVVHNSSLEDKHKARMKAINKTPENGKARYPEHDELIKRGYTYTSDQVGDRYTHPSHWKVSKNKALKSG